MSRHEREVLDAVGEVLSGHLGATQQALVGYADQLRNTLAAELRAIAQELRRAPEVSIKYHGVPTDGAANTLHQ